MKFKVSDDGAYNILLNTLADIYSWQQIIINQLADRVAEKGEFSKQDVLKVWEEQRQEPRQRLIEHLYSNHGPDYFDSDDG